MHGPEAASIMRSDLHFEGTIIGKIFFPLFSLILIFFVRPY